MTSTHHVLATLAHSTRRCRLLLTLAVVTALAVAQAVLSSRVTPHGDQSPLDAAAYAAIVCGAVALGVSPRWPRTATTIVTAVLCLFIVRDYSNGPVWIDGPVVLSVLGWHSNRRAAIAGGAAMTAALTLAVLLTGEVNPVIPAVFVGWCVAAVLLGDAVRTRRLQAASAAERARMAEQARIDEAARRMAELRLRVAQDLHDTVAHAVVTINVQAAAAARMLIRDPDAAAESLQHIQAASAEVLDELSGVLATLRDEEDGAALAPTPSAHDIPALVAAIPTARLDIALDARGPLDRLPKALSTTTYRLVQECLTNSLRHSRATTVAVALDAQADTGRVTVQVDDPGPAHGTASPSHGVGLRGMAERVAMTGGTLTAGSTPSGGFVVSARWQEVGFQ